MISNNDIGNLGRLGNQMFQYATLRGIASNLGYSYCLPPEDYVGVKDPNCANSDVNIFQCFKLRPAPRLLTNFSTYTERYFHFDEWLWDNCPDNVNFWGYFQTEKYFKNIENEIREDFTFVDEIYEPCRKEFSDIFGSTKVLALHIRRGDYLKYPNHPIQSEEYYENAINLFDKDIPIMIFSDDIEWCKEQPMFRDDRFIFSDNNNTAIDLCLLSMCKYHIIANSSFSWWGSWLAKSEKTIAPSVWFAGTDGYKNLKDLYLKEWEVL